MKADMKRTFAILSLIVPLLCFQSCDFFRKIAGCPTSDYIEAKAARLEAEKKEMEKKQAPVDSARLAEEVLPEEVQPGKVSATVPAATAVPAAVPSVAKRSSLMDGASKQAIGAGYCIVVGSFGNKNNAVKLASRIKEAGYPVVLIPMTNGLTAVGTCPSDNIDEVSSSLAKLLNESFCPKDAWILDAR